MRAMVYSIEQRADTQVGMIDTLNCGPRAARAARPVLSAQMLALMTRIAAAASTMRNRVLAILKREGVMLESGQGPVPNLVEFIAGEPVKGNWWSHPQSHSIFALTRSVRDSPDVLTCRLVNGKVTFVHRRVWPALVCLANLFPHSRLAAIHEVHTRTGAHKVITIPFPAWVPNRVMTAGRRLSAEHAVSSLGIWASAVASTGAARGPRDCL
jgi:hypothetical protein